MIKPKATCFKVRYQLNGVTFERSFTAQEQAQQHAAELLLRGASVSLVTELPHGQQIRGGIGGGEVIK
jgi:hypothetical protein